MRGEATTSVHPLRRSGVVLLSVIALSAFSAGALRAQASRSGGTLEGSVLDPSGATVPGATVEAVGLDSGSTRTTATDARGRWTIPELAVGTYRVRVTLSGFAPAEATGVRVQVGQTIRLPVTLEPATLATAVTVVAEAGGLEPTRTAAAVTVENERILELPVRNRTSLGFVLLAPGVAPTVPQAVGAGALGDSGFSFGGLRPRSNSLTIDGVDNTEEYTGASRTALSLEIVREFQIVNAGISAETGGASGGGVNVVTKTGTNVFHGDLFALSRLEPLSAGSSSSAAAGPRRRWRGGAALNGPIVHDRTFFALAAEQEHARSPGLALEPGATLAIDQAIRAGGPLRAVGPGTLGAGRSADEETEVSIKLNHTISAGHALMGRYAYVNDRRAGDAFGVDTLTDASARGSQFVRDHGMVASLLSTFPGSVNDLRLQGAWRHVTLRTGTADGPGVVVPGVARFGRPWEGNSRRTETRFQAVDAFSVVRGRHLLKIGAGVNHVRLDTDTADGSAGLYTFASVADLASGRPDSFRQSFGTFDTHIATTTGGGFVQDRATWGRLTLEMGVRYDYAFLPRGVPTDGNDVAPRFGASFAAGPKTVLRGFAGRLHDRYVLAALERPLREEGTRASEQVLDPVDAARVLGGPAGRLTTPWPSVRPSRFDIDPTLRTPESDQLGLSVERLLAADLTLSASYLYVRGRYQQRTRNVNLVSATDGVFGAARVDPEWNDVFRLDSSSRSRYHGLTLLLNRRFAREMAWSVAYALSAARDDASDFDEQPRDPLNLAAEWSWSRQDQRHRLVVNGLFDVFENEEARPGEGGRPARPSLLRQLLGQWEIAPIVTLASGRPVNPLLPFDLTRSHAYPPSARPPGAARNSLRSPATLNLDLRIVKYFAVGKRGKLDLVADVFNALNRANVVESDPFAPGRAGRAQRPIALAPRREVQLTLDFEF